MERLKRGSKLPFWIRNLIVDYHLRKLSAITIQRKLKVKHGFQTTRQSVHGIISKFKSAGSVQNTRRRTSETILRPVHKKIINFWMTKNSEMTAQAIVDRLFEKFNLRVSVTTVKKVRKELGWSKKVLKYCQLISAKNQIARYYWACDVLVTYEDFKDVVFVDESSVEMSSTGRMFFHKASSDIMRLPGKSSRPKHPYKVHVWAGISYRGRTDICIFTGTMDSVIYQKILSSNFLPFVTRKFSGSYRLYQDNDSKHCSKSTIEWMKQHGVDTHLMKAPASSPDLNPIENVWASLKDYLQRKIKPKKKEDLIAGIVDFWEKLTAAQCARYIDHVHKVLPEVVLNFGGPTNY